VQKLHLVGFTTEHDGLIFSARRGARSGGYVLYVDDEVAAAVRELAQEAAERAAEEAAQAAAEARRESTLPVREVQARLRAGRSIEEVAADAGVDPAWVERFAPPVQAEMAQVIRTVGAARLSRPRLGPSDRPIGEAMRHNLAVRGVRMTAGELAEAWSARQEDDRRWVVECHYRYRQQDHQPAFELDVATGEVRPIDKVAAQMGFVAPPEPPRPTASKDTASKRSRSEPDASRGRSGPRSRAARERDRATAAMRRDAARRAGEAERAAAKLAAERAKQREEAERRAEAARAAKRAARKRAAVRRRRSRRRRPRRRRPRRRRPRRPRRRRRRSKQPAKKRHGKQPAKKRAASGQEAGGSAAKKRAATGQEGCGGPEEAGGAGEEEGGGREEGSAGEEAGGAGQEAGRPKEQAALAKKRAAVPKERPAAAASRRPQRRSRRRRSGRSSSSPSRTCGPRRRSRWPSPRCRRPARPALQRATAPAGGPAVRSSGPSGRAPTRAARHGLDRQRRRPRDRRRANRTGRLRRSGQRPSPRAGLDGRAGPCRCEPSRRRCARLSTGHGGDDHGGVARTPTIEELRAVGASHGLDALGVTSAAPFPETRRHLEERKAAGLHGGMRFTYRRPEVSSDPARALPGAQALVIAARSYLVDDPGPAHDDPGPQGRVARYAWRDHYRDLRDALTAVAEVLREAGWGRGCSPTTTPWSTEPPRSVPASAGSARTPTSCCRVAGAGTSSAAWSRLPRCWPSPDPVEDGCGTCRRCLDGCPTGAIVAPGVVDARRCLAWILQDEGPFPRQHRVALGDRVYGCDDCQEVCPVNRRSATTAGQAVTVRPRAPLLALLDPDDAVVLGWADRWYIPRREVRYVRRNALVALGNTGPADDPGVEGALRAHLAHPDPLLRSHAVWAAARLGRHDLLAGMAADPDPEVAAELDLAGVAP
jgi:epoxyqueuosine reductase